MTWTQTPAGWSEAAVSRLARGKGVQAEGIPSRMPGAGLAGGRGPGRPWGGRAGGGGSFLRMFANGVRLNHTRGTPQHRGEVARWEAGGRGQEEVRVTAFIARLSPPEQIPGSTSVVGCPAPA